MDKFRCIPHLLFYAKGVIQRIMKVAKKAGVYISFFFEDAL